MSDRHYEKWFFKSLIGILLIGGGIFFMYYTISFLDPEEKWVYYALACGLSIAIGAFLLSSGAVHKMKSDLIKKQKLRQQSS